MIKRAPLFDIIAMVLPATPYQSKEAVQKDNNSLAHMRWDCTYHIIIIPKYRRKVMYAQTRKEVGEILRKFCGYKQVIRDYIKNQEEADMIEDKINP